MPPCPGFYLRCRRLRWDLPARYSLLRWSRPGRFCPLLCPTSLLRVSDSLSARRRQLALWLGRLSRSQRRWFRSSSDPCPSCSLGQRHLSAGCGAKSSSLRCRASGRIGRSVSAAEQGAQFGNLRIYLKPLLLKSGNCSSDDFWREFSRHLSFLPPLIWKYESYS